MDLKVYQELSKRTMPKVGSTITQDGDSVVLSRAGIVSNYALGVGGESGELADYLKKVLYHGHEFERDHVIKELGDIMHYVSGIATLYDIDMEDVLDVNITKLSKRFPNGFNSKDSIKRVDVEPESPRGLPF